VVCGSCSKTSTQTERPQPVRQRKANLCARVNGDLALRFTADGLTSHSGLEVFRLYLRKLDFTQRLRRHLKAVDPGADYASTDVIRVFIAMFAVGARRLSHVRYLGSDPVVRRFVELRVLPGDRTLARWLSRCKASARSTLLAFMMEIIGDSLRPLRLRRLTIGSFDRPSGRACVSRLQPTSPQGTELLPDHRLSRADRTSLECAQPVRQRPRRQGVDELLPRSFR
jgi:hypothetical protein